MGRAKQQAIPIYRAPTEAYQADTCVNVVRAVERGQIRHEALVHGHYPGRQLPPGALPGLKTVGHWDATRDQDWGLDWHRNEGIELTLVERGTIGFAVEGRAYQLEPGDLTITRPWQQHRVGNPRVAAGRLDWLIVDVGVRRPNQAWHWPPWLLLSGADREELTRILRHNEQPVWRASPELRRCFQEIGRTVASPAVESRVSHLAVRLNDALLLLLDLLRQKSVTLDESLSSSRHTVKLFVNDLREHPEHLAMEWTVEEMARSCGLGTTQFVYHVRSLTNMTPAHYVLRLRLEQAARLLRERPAASVTDVALACGFSSSQYFATVFGRRFGCSPREFRAGGGIGVVTSAAGEPER